MVQRDSEARKRPLGRVLVTGAAGFLGSALVQRLVRRGDDVVITDLAPNQATPAGLRTCDLTQRDQVEHLLRDEAFDTIIHAGAVSGPMVMADHPLEIWRINVMGTAYLLEAARRSGIGRFVLCSSIDVYGPTPIGLINDDTALAPQSVYGASKVAAEAALAGYAGEHGMDGVALRFSWIYGPGRRTPTLLERLIRAGLAGKAIALDHAASETTHYLFIDDAAAGVLAAAEAPGNLRRRAYNITAGNGVTLRAVVGLLGSLLPELRVTFGRDTAPATAAASFDLADAARDLGYRPLVSLSDGLRRYVSALAEALKN